jgi:hypothetical protein
MKNSQKLRDMWTYYHDSPNMKRQAKRSAAVRLASFGFDNQFIAKALGLSGTVVQGYTKRDVARDGVPYPKNFNPNTLDTLMLMAVAYEDDESVSPHLLRLCEENGTHIMAVSALTGIPIRALRGAQHD